MNSHASRHSLTDIDVNVGIDIHPWCKERLTSSACRGCFSSLAYHHRRILTYKWTPLLILPASTVPYWFAIIHDSLSTLPRTRDPFRYLADRQPSGLAADSVIVYLSGSPPQGKLLGSVDLLAFQVSGQSSQMDNLESGEFGEGRRRWK